ncbi:hypothetical protein [Mesorhizobium sp. INR15]|nr:hypothetical protein [Mesorhizobium sp. INR15]
MVVVLGRSDAEFGLFRRDIATVRRDAFFDETAIWKQILLHPGDL